MSHSPQQGALCLPSSRIIRRLAFILGHLTNGCQPLGRVVNVAAVADGASPSGARCLSRAAARRHAREAEVLAALTEFGEDVDDRAKESPVDVPVWRASHGNDPAWPSPWGPGRPGWHAECTAMVLDTYGSSLDIHAGGADLAFPHHAYEAAQAEAATGVAPFARSWMRVGTVRIGGDKMAKSTGNLVLVSDLLKEHRGAALRLMILDRRWWEAWDFEPGLLTAAEGRLDALNAAAGRRSDDDAAEVEVMRLLLDDIDVPSATAVALESGGRAARVLVQVLGLS